MPEPLEVGAAAKQEASLAGLLDAVAEFIRSYVVMGAEQADTCALWAAHTHVVDAFELSPYLALKSAEKRSGKTTTMKALELVVARPWRVVTPTEAVVFRKIDRDRPTILLDEYDAIFKARDQEPLRALLNAGNEPGTTVPRCAGANRDKLTDFAIYCAKALAGLGKLPDTVADRTIAVELKRKKPGERAARWRRREARAVAEPLRERLAAFGEQHVDALAEARPELPDELDDRALDTWEPLLAIADLAGADWPERARSAALALSGEAREDDSAGVLLLRDLRAVFGGRGADRLASSAICDDLHEIEESPWADWYGKPITVRGVAKLLGRYGIKPKQLWAGGANVRGYEKASFGDAWSRHLPSDPPDTASYPLDPLDGSSHAASRPKTDPLGGADLADAKEAANLHEQTDLADLADKTPGKGPEGPAGKSEQLPFRGKEPPPPEAEQGGDPDADIPF